MHVKPAISIATDLSTSTLPAALAPLPPPAGTGPTGQDYLDTAAATFSIICDARTKAWFPTSLRKNRYGLFATINVGLSYGKGRSSLAGSTTRNTLCSRMGYS
ncbi:hypothetical protein B0H14DRAFT_2618263 [Mycena olivaceomarginata]|nr:hypothetical protein B0H14DRAFT_2618263 [Mycena olivaceomarginata]